jgi:hypothetical protein
VTMLQSPTTFEAFNARWLTPGEVALNFVPSRHYKDLAKRRHSMVIGPRGSGKTTLLKMLQQPALEVWPHQLADEYRSLIDYTGVFVAADLSWSAQIEALGGGKLDPKIHRQLSSAMFTTHVLRALVMAMLYRVESFSGTSKNRFGGVALSDEGESILVRKLCEAWKVQTAIPSLLALKQSLTLRLLETRSIANREALSGDGRSERLAEIEFFNLHFLDALSVATEVFDDLVDQQDGKWALLFDELELAPQWIQDELLGALRSTNPKFIYKLALSPFTYNANLMSALAAAPGQDFDEIALWYVERNQSYRFCEELWYALLKAKGIEPKPPQSLLGSSYFEKDDEGSVYAPNSMISQRFVSLAESDYSFRTFLEEKRVDPRRLHELPESAMDSVVRKISNLVILREHYRAHDREVLGGRRIRTRSRKTAALYVGAESLFAVSEGNPRWFIAITNRLLDRWQMTSKKIRHSAQAIEILRGSQRFAAMLRTIPSPPVSSQWRKRGLLSLIDTIATFFHEQAVVKEFVAEPPATFIVDSHISDDILAILGQALNSGAIVYVPDTEGQLLLTSLRGKRFRISYLLAPLYKLPLRLGVAVSLSSILKSDVALNDRSLPFREETK